MSGSVNLSARKFEVLKLASREVHLLPLQPLTVNVAAVTIEDIDTTPLGVVKVEALPGARLKQRAAEFAARKQALLKRATGEAAAADVDARQVAFRERAACKGAARP